MSKLLDRRQALLCGASFGAAALLPSQISAETGKPLAYPPLLDATSSRQFRLTAQAGTTQFNGGAATQTLGYNQSYLGPTLRVMTDAGHASRSPQSTPRASISPLAWFACCG